MLLPKQRPATNKHQTHTHASLFLFPKDKDACCSLLHKSKLLWNRAPRWANCHPHKPGMSFHVPINGKIHSHEYSFTLCCMQCWCSQNSATKLFARLFKAHQPVLADSHTHMTLSHLLQRGRSLQPTPAAVYFLFFSGSPHTLLTLLALTMAIVQLPIFPVCKQDSTPTSAATWLFALSKRGACPSSQFQETQEYH